MLGRYGKGTSKGQRNNMLRQSPFEVEYWKTSKQTNKQTCNLPNSPETKHGKAKNDRKKSLDEVSAEQNHLHPYLALVNGTSKSKETMNCCSDSCKLQSLCLSGRNDGAQPHFCSHDQSTPLLALNTCCNTQKARCWGGNSQKDIKEQGRGRKTYKVLSLNPLYQIEEHDWKISFNKSWVMNNPAIFSLKILNCSKNMTLFDLAQWTYPLSRF